MNSSQTNAIKQKKKIQLPFNDYISKLPIDSYTAMLIMACVVISLYLTIKSPFFFSIQNFSDILLGASVIGIISFGMTMVLISDGIDLSVGAVLAFASVTMCVCINRGIPLLITLLIVAIGCILIGIVNGFFIACLKINAFIITLGTMSVIRGVSFIVIGGRPLPFSNDIVRSIGSGRFLGIPIPIYFLMSVLAILSFTLKYTQFGRNVYAIGNNEETARLSGIDVVKTRILVFSIMALLAGVSGFLLSAQTYAGIPAAGQGYELDALTAVILGGTSLKGGEGKLFGTVLGTLIVSLVINGQNLMNVPYFYQLVSKGIIILIAMTLANRRSK